MTERGYLMESEDEAIRLDVKTDGRVVEEQARWAGLRPGMRVADLGCGSGKTSYHLHALAQPGGRTVGVDMAPQRIAFARSTYRAEGLEFARFAWDWLRMGYLNLRSDVFAWKAATSGRCELAWLPVTCERLSRSVRRAGQEVTASTCRLA